MSGRGYFYGDAAMDRHHDISNEIQGAAPAVDFIDIPNNATTPASVSVGMPFSGSIETAFDADWVAVNLVAGQSYQFNLDGSGGSPLSDPYLELLNGAGTVLAFDDDGGIGANSQLGFTATASGTYFLNVRAFSSFTGDYTLSMQSVVPLPVFTMPEIATYLTDGYWDETGRSRHAFAVAPNSPTISYNIDALTSEGQALAIGAFATWSAVTGISFVQTNGAASITFDDNQSGAFAGFVASNHVTSSSNVNISTDWLTSYGTGVNSYSFQTYIHEIGHSLGLGHAGNYNGSAGWSAVAGGDNHYLNDSWQATVMSYFDQDENSYVNATRAYVIGPMIADIIAIQTLYGVPTNVEPGNTVYGFNSTALGSHDFGSYTEGSMVAFAIFDSGGTDTLDASGFVGGQLISLQPGTYSNIGGEVGNIGIAVNTIIENAYGGVGNDTINGNTASNSLSGGGGTDTINGGQGDDTLNGGPGGDSLNGGLGFDYIDYGQAGAGVTVDLTNPGRNTGHAFGDTYTGIEGINGSSYNDELWGDAGNNTINGRAGNDTIYGGLGADTLGGGAGNDTLLGGQGWDFLYGRDGNDTLNGAKGNDLLSGEAGNDTFIFTTGGMADTIIDFTQGGAVGDVLQLSVGTAFDTFAEVIAACTQVGGDVVMNFGGGDSITLYNCSIGGFAMNDFAFV